MNEFKMLQKLKFTWGLNVLTYFLDCGNRNFSFKNLMDHDTIKRIQKKKLLQMMSKNT